MNEATVPPTIYLPSGCKPSKVCSRDGTRPMLTNAYLRKREDGWWLCATDRYIAVALRAEATGDAKPLPAEHLRILRAAAEGRLTLSNTARWEIDYESRPDYKVRRRLQARGLIDYARRDYGQRDYGALTATAKGRELLEDAGRHA